MKLFDIICIIFKKHIYLHNMKFEGINVKKSAQYNGGGAGGRGMISFPCTKLLQGKYFFIFQPLNVII